VTCHKPSSLRPSPLGSALTLAPYTCHHPLYNHLHAVIWVISHDHLPFEPSSGPPCRTTKSRRASHWPVTHSPENSRVATRSSPLPPYFKTKHESSVNSQGIMAGSQSPSRVLCQFCIRSPLVLPLSAWCVGRCPCVFHVSDGLVYSHSCLQMPFLLASLSFLLYETCLFPTFASL